MTQTSPLRSFHKFVRRTHSRCEHDVPARQRFATDSDCFASKVAVDIRKLSHSRESALTFKVGTALASFPENEQEYRYSTSPHKDNAAPSTSAPHALDCKSAGESLKQRTPQEVSTNKHTRQTASRHGQVTTSQAGT